ncbi:MAG: ATP-binding protein [Bacteroidaceae bacterium]|nr:ATP-binding protein [Bacteroidaceae bacterium]
MKIERDILKDLKAWKEKNGRKPLMLFGARQTGKTWILKEFGRSCFDRYAYFNFDEEEHLGELFSKTKSPARLLEQLSHLTGFTISASDTLIIFDEIQECPKAIESLKYFCEQCPEYAIVTAGSLLGIMLGHKDFSFPVGKVDHLNMYPVTFSEFLRAKDKSLSDYYHSIDTIEQLPQIFFDRLSASFDYYRISGGMPESVVAILENHRDETDRILSSILKDYTLDFVKHSTPLIANRIGHIWENLPSQLSKENRKFIYSQVRSGARAREYEDALIWLKNAGLIYQVMLCTKPFIPLKAYDQINSFKIYACDIGLLRVLADLDNHIYETTSDQFREFKGGLTENYVLQSLIPQFGKNIRYWSSGNKAEVEFLIQFDNSIIPVEAKSAISVKSKSLSVYDNAYHPKIRLRYSMKNLSQAGNLINIPLFLADKTRNLLKACSKNE